MLSLDVRDLTFWFKQAQKKLIQDQIKRIQASRLAMAEQNDYSRIISDLEFQIRTIDLGKKAVAQEGWAELRSMSRRKGK